MMPPQWYREDPTAYEWQRGDPLSWFLFARHARMRVFVPGNRARARARRDAGQPFASRRCDDGLRRRAEPHSTSRSGSGGGRAAVRYARSARRSAPGSRTFTRRSCVPAGTTLRFAFICSAASVAIWLRRDLSGRRTRSCVHAYGASPTSHCACRPTVRSAALRSLSRRAASTAIPKSSETSRTSANRGMLARRRLRRTAERSSTGSFRSPADGAFDINFMHAFPNDWNDASQRVVGLWLRRARAARRSLPASTTTSTRCPAQNCAGRSRCRAAAYSSTAGRRRAPVFLRAGRHESPAPTAK